MPQGSYTINTNPQIAGSPGFANAPYTAFSYSNPLSVLKPGYGVVLGSAQKFCRLPDNTNRNFVGVVLRDLSFAAQQLPTSDVSNTVNTTYPIDSAISVMSRGQVQALVVAAVTAGSNAYLVYKKNDQVQTLVFSADIITGNTVTGTVNGVAISQAFNTTNAQTLTDLAADIAAVDGVASASSNGTDTITVTADVDTEVEIEDMLITGGASQATIAVTQTQALVSTDDIGKFFNADGASAFGTAVAFAISSGLRWIEDSATDSQGNLVAMLDVNVPGAASIS